MSVSINTTICIMLTVLCATDFHMKYGGKMLYAEQAINNRSDRGAPRAIARSSHPPVSSDVSMSGFKKIIDTKSMYKKKIACSSSFCSSFVRRG